MKRILLLGALVVVAASSCSTKRNLVYFGDLKDVAKLGSGSRVFEPIIQENDLLAINISTQSPESNVLFAVNADQKGNSSEAYGSGGYKVSKKGEVKLPVIGSTILKGLTIEQAQQAIAQKLDRYVKNSLVKINYLNFRVTVIGEVNTPSTFTLPDENINLLQALGMAGDMTPYGRRENVLVIRDINGDRKVARLNLNKGNVFDSPFFYLKQNDVVYVEADKSKALEYSKSTRLMPLFVATISALAVLTTTLIR
jgi:polysaccharide biosynthesis/export protein